jgi:hypothetical protein
LLILWKNTLYFLSFFFINNFVLYWKKKLRLNTVLKDIIHKCIHYMYKENKLVRNFHLYQVKYSKLQFKLNQLRLGMPLLLIILISNILFSRLGNVSWHVYLRTVASVSRHMQILHSRVLGGYIKKYLFSVWYRWKFLTKLFCKLFSWGTNMKFYLLLFMYSSFKHVVSLASVISLSIVLLVHYPVL